MKYMLYLRERFKMSHVLCKALRFGKQLSQALRLTKAFGLTQAFELTKAFELRKKLQKNLVLRWVFALFLACEVLSFSGCSRIIEEHGFKREIKMDAILQSGGTRQEIAHAFGKPSFCIKFHSGIARTSYMKRFTKQIAFKEFVDDVPKDASEGNFASGSNVEDEASIDVIKNEREGSSKERISHPRIGERCFYVNYSIIKQMAMHSKLGKYTVAEMDFDTNGKLLSVDLREGSGTPHELQFMPKKTHIITRNVSPISQFFQNMRAHTSS